MNDQVKFMHVDIVVHAGKTAQALSKHSRLRACQKSMLESAFVNNSYPNRIAIKQLAQKTGVSQQKVYGWFERKRRELRLGIKEGTLSTSEYTHIQGILNVLSNKMVKLCMPQ